MKMKIGIFAIIFIALIFSKNVALAGIDIYQKFVSPHKGWHCAFSSIFKGDLSCSAYGKNAIENYGVIEGIFKILDRFEACRLALDTYHNLSPTALQNNCSWKQIMCAKFVEKSFEPNEAKNYASRRDSLLSKKTFIRKPKPPSEEEMKQAIKPFAEHVDGIIYHKRQKFDVNSIVILGTSKIDSDNGCLSVSAKTNLRDLERNYSLDHQDVYTLCKKGWFGGFVVAENRRGIYGYEK